MRLPAFLGLALATVATCALAAACSGGPARTAEPATRRVPVATLDASQATMAPPGPLLGSQRHGELVVWLSSTPAQPLEGSAEIDAYLAETGGGCITDARVTFDTDMTNMSHGLYLVAAEPVGNGHYVGRVHFSMPGPWRIITIVERPGQERARLRFEFRVGAE
jgi:hypothetical protein